MGQVPARVAYGREWARRRARSLIRRRGRSFRGCDEGSVTVETVAWFPVFITILSLIADMAMIHTVNGEMWHVAYDAARRMSREELSTADAPGHVTARLPGYMADVATVSARMGESDVELAVAAPSSAITVVGLYGLIGEHDIGARVRLPRGGGDGEPDLSQFDDLYGAGAPAGGA